MGISHEQGSFDWTHFTADAQGKLGSIYVSGYCGIMLETGKII